MDNKLKVVDLFNGQKDLENKIIRAVGNPNDRFSEDALRMIRAVRLACVLNFKIEDKTSKAISNNSKLIKIVSSERIRDEFLKIIMSDNAHDGSLCFLPNCARYFVGAVCSCLRNSLLKLVASFTPTRLAMSPTESFVVRSNFLERSTFMRPT